MRDENECQHIEIKVHGNERLVTTASIFAGILLIPLPLQEVLHYSALKTGLFLLPQALAMGLAMTVGLNALPSFRVARAMSMNHVVAQITASVAVVLFSMFFEAKRSVYALVMPAQEAGVLAVQQLFMGMGVIALLVVPVSIRWMHNKHHGQLGTAAPVKNDYFRWLKKRKDKIRLE